MNISVFSAQAMCSNTCLGPWRCVVKFDHIGQIGLKPALISHASKMYSVTTKSVSSIQISQTSTLM